ncbi:MAG: hypothetical protein JXR07_07910 [Reichenbachiella sp.]
MSSLSRTILFFGSVSILLVNAYKFIFVPSKNYFLSNQQLSDEEAARQIGLYFPEFNDKLLNTIQLGNIISNSELVAASINQRSESLSVFKFSQGIKLHENKKFAKYIYAPALIILVTLLFIPQYFSESTKRIVNYDKEFEETQLFQFDFSQSLFDAFKNEDYLLEFEVKGEAIPDLIYVLANGRRHKMKIDKKGIASYNFVKIQKSFNFSILASDYQSPSYKVEAKERPELQSINIKLQYPTYTRLKNENISNIGNINVPEGSLISWTVGTNATNNLDLFFNNQLFNTYSSDNQSFNFSRTAKSTEPYQLILKNEHGMNKDSLQYFINVNKDQYPKLSMEYYQDTTLYSYIVFNGLISDDYGISALELIYKQGKELERIDLPFSYKLNAQNFFYQWSLDSLDLNPGDNIEFFVRVWDNDGINGRKFSKSSSFNLIMPKKDEVKEKIDRQSSSAKNNLDKTLQETQDLNDQIQKIQNELKSKKELDWKDEKRIEDLIDQKEKLQKDIKELSEKHRSLMEQREHFDKPNKNLQEKARQLQELMDQVLDDETKALYEELQKLLAEETDGNQIEDMMDQIQKKEANMEKEIERAIEMFKRMQFDYKMDEIIKDLDALEKKQNDLSNSTKEKKSDLEAIKKEQQNQTEEFENIKEEIDQLNNLNNELKSPEQIESLEKESQEIDKELNQSQEELNSGNKKKASQSQKNAAQKMNKMKKKMQDMQMSMEMEMMQENLQNLRDIVDNLVKLSFDQEHLMVNFRGVNQSDPRYVQLSQDQLKLKDDAVIIQDSLLSLAERVFQIQSFVTRELADMNENIENSLQNLKDRHKSQAVANQQYAMTSINNLALLLDDILQQMMQQMADAMGAPQDGKKGKKQPTPALSELQQQLNNKIEGLKKSGKSGRELSQQLSELAAEQELLRQKLQKMEGQLGEQDENAKKGLSEAIKKMEQSETDLIYKRINRQTINRQKEILTRMLDAEKAMQERELDKKRQGEEAQETQKNIPPALEEYLKAKSKELELLNSIPLKMSPYYKQEVNKYFKRLNEQ